MSHDRGCPCGRERYEYEDCTEKNCIKIESEDIIMYDLGNIWKLIGSLSFSDLRDMAQVIVDTGGGEVPNDTYKLANLLSEIAENVGDE